MEILLKETNKFYRIKVNGTTRLSISKDHPNARIYAKSRAFDIMFTTLQFRSLGSTLCIEEIDYIPRKEPSYMTEMRDRNKLVAANEGPIMKVV